MSILTPPTASILDSGGYSRRRFIGTAGAAFAGSLFLKGCAINPPSAADLSPKAQAMTLSPSITPEITTVKLGYIAIVESAPLIIAKEKGFFDRHGMFDVGVSKQASWGAARDNIEIGSDGGGIDGGQWQMPMPQLISEGIITKGNRKIPMLSLAQLSTQGNGIAIGYQHKGRGFKTDVSGAADYVKSMNDSGTPFKAAYTFPRVNQDFWIRYWLAAGGIDPNKDVNLIAVPAAQTVASMRTGSMDGFSTGDPWPSRILRDKRKFGFMATLTAQIWPAHPEEYFAMREDWIRKYPKATKAILKGIMEAQIWCDDPKNRTEMMAILAQRKYFNVPSEILEGSYIGEYVMGDQFEKITDPGLAVRYWKDSRGSVSYPYKSHDLWFLTESVRWGFLPQGTLAEADRIVNAVSGEKYWREAAQELGLSAKDIPTTTSRGIETFFDGAEFNPEAPKKYLDSLRIKSLRV
jgi:bicarbonate transport system substrate-binding protein